VSFSRWLRSNSEHYLLLDAQARAAAKHGLAQPPPPKRTRELFWRKVFVPIYRQLPWSVRRASIALMPGSHRQHWSPPPIRHKPAV
jgi:hypothetical protein